MTFTERLDELKEATESWNLFVDEFNTWNGGQYSADAMIDRRDELMKRLDVAKLNWNMTVHIEKLSEEV